VTDDSQLGSPLEATRAEDRAMPGGADGNWSAAAKGAPAALEALLHARVVAVIGASRDPRRLGGRPVDLLSRHGYEGRVYAINPNRETADQVQSYPSILEVPEPVW
jgi:hypothetical protein